MSAADGGLRFLITGGAGYIGSVLIEHVLARGHAVTCLDNLLFNDHNLFGFCANPHFDFVLADARDEHAIRKALRGADVIVPLAGIVGAPACDRDPGYTTSTNLEAVRLVNRLRSKNQIVIYPNTNSGYGTKSGDQYCTEDSPLEPISLYGQTKVQAELDLLDSENVVTFRLATVFGTSPRMRLDLLVNHFTYAAMTDGYIVIFEKDFRRNYVHVRDVADCFLYAVEHMEAMANRPYNLGLDDANLSKEQLALKIKEYVPDFYIHFAPIGSDPDKRDYIVSNRRLEEAGFKAKRTVDDGIKELMKAYLTLGRVRYKNVDAVPVRARG